MKGTTNSATATLAPLKTSGGPFATTFSPSLTPPTIFSENSRTLILPTSGSQCLAPLTVPEIATPVPQLKSKLTSLAAPPTNETALSGASEQPNSPLPAVTVQEALSVPLVHILSPAQDTPITAW